MPDDSSPSCADLPLPPPEDDLVVIEQRIRRLDWSLVGDVVLGVFNAERGFWYTMRGYVMTPRAAFEGYLGRDRMRFNNPLKMVVFLSALTAFVVHQLHVLEVVPLGGDEQLNPEAEKAAAFMQRNYNLLLLSALPVMALVSRLLYRGRVYNFLEHLALNAFEVSVITVAYIVMLPTIVLWPAINVVYLVLALIYQAWFYRQVLGPSWIRAVVTTLVVTLSYFAVMLSVSLLVSSLS